MLASPRFRSYQPRQVATKAATSISHIAPSFARSSRLRISVIMPRATAEPCVNATTCIARVRPLSRLKGPLRRHCFDIDGLRSANSDEPQVLGEQRPNIIPLEPCGMKKFVQYQSKDSRLTPSNISLAFPTAWEHPTIRCLKNQHQQGSNFNDSFETT